VPAQTPVRTASGLDAVLVWHLADHASPQTGSLLTCRIRFGQRRDFDEQAVREGRVETLPAPLLDDCHNNLGLHGANDRISEQAAEQSAVSGTGLAEIVLYRFIYLGAGA
jgi:hypothetical protein